MPNPNINNDKNLYTCSNFEFFKLTTPSPVLTPQTTPRIAPPPPIQYASLCNH